MGAKISKLGLAYFEFRAFPKVQFLKPYCQGYKNFSVSFYNKIITQPKKDIETKGDENDNQDRETKAEEAKQIGHGETEADGNNN